METGSRRKGFLRGGVSDDGPASDGHSSVPYKCVSTRTRFLREAGVRTVTQRAVHQSQLGELFVLRNAGNIVPCHGASNGGEPATIEYAVTALGVKDIIVCGHSGCGALHAMLHPENMASLPLVRGWLNHAEATRLIVTENYSKNKLSGDELLDIAVREHVLVQIENLQTHPAVAVKLQRGELTLHGWVYQMETGEILAYSTKDNAFVSLTGLTPREASKRNIANPRKAGKTVTDKVQTKKPTH